MMLDIAAAREGFKSVRS